MTDLNTCSGASLKSKLNRSTINVCTDTSKRIFFQILTIQIALALTLVTSVSNAQSSSVTTRFQYDAGDNVTSVTDPRGLVTSYTHDGLGLVWQQISPDTGTVNFTQDTYGRLSSLTRADNVQTVYGYDDINRQTSISAAGQSQAIVYDNCANGIGRLCSVSDATGSTSYSYTPEGWVGGRGFTLTNTTYAIGYGHDNMGRVASVVYPDGNQAIYAYSNGVVSNVSLKIGNAAPISGASVINYRPMDVAMSGWTSSNGLTNAINYDTDGRIVGISVPSKQALAINYDNADRIAQIANGIDNTLTQNFAYDYMSRLTTTSSLASSESFQYDANGNRTSQTGIVDAIDPASNHLISNGTNQYGYDVNGNTTTVAGAQRYHYDAFNRLNSAAGTNYYVNPEGQRLSKTGTSGTTYFAPDMSNALMAENSGAGWIDYIWLNGQLIGRVASGQVYAIHDDQVGRPEAVTDANQALQWRAQNFAFTQNVVLSNIALNLGFPGQYFDSETSVWNNGYRDYKSGLGRYIESDPAGLNGGINTYTYAKGNPISLVDIFGLTSCPKKMTFATGAVEPVYPELYVLGIGRLLYAGAAAVIPSIAAATTETDLGAAAVAVGARNSLKVTFRLGFFPNFRIYSVGTVLAKYNGNAVEALAAAGRTNAALNTGAVAATAMAAGNSQATSDENCGCQ